MARNLRRFVNETEYQQATLSYPAVSWVTGTDAVHFDKTAPATNNKVMMAWTSTDSGNISNRDIVLWNGGASLPPTDLFTDLTVNDANVMSDLTADATLYNYAQPDTDYVVKYGLINNSQITDIFSVELGGGWGSSAGPIEFFIPSSVSEITHTPDNVKALVIDNTTPPYFSGSWSSFLAQEVYVPDAAVNTYQSEWEHAAGIIYPISQYSGNLPI